MRLQKIIPAVSSYKDLSLALEMDFKYLILLNFHINHLDDLMDKIKKSKRKALVHIDLIHGLAGDKYGAEYLCQRLKVDGIISTKPAALQIAKAHGCIAIQRIFLIDTNSLTRSLEMVRKTNPDYLEILPGLATNALKMIASQVDMPIIGGGLITEAQEIYQGLESGLIAVSTGKRELWKLDIK